MTICLPLSFLHAIQTLHLVLHLPDRQILSTQHSADSKGQHTSARKCGDQTGTHFKEVHGVRSLPRGEEGGNAGQRSREGGAKLRHIVGWACKVNAQPGSVETCSGAGPLRSGRPGFKAHCFQDVI